MFFEKIIEKFEKNVFIKEENIINLITKINFKNEEERSEKFEALLHLLQKHKNLKYEIKKELEELKQNIKNIDMKIKEQSNLRELYKDIENILNLSFKKPETHYETLRKIFSKIEGFIQKNIGFERIYVALGFGKKKIGDVFFYDIFPEPFFISEKTEYLKIFYSTGLDPNIKEMKKFNYKDEIGGLTKHIINGNPFELCCNWKKWREAEKFSKKSQEGYKNYKDWFKKNWEIYKDLEVVPMWRGAREIKFPLKKINENYGIGLINADVLIRRGLKGKINEFLDMILSQVDLSFTLGKKKMNYILSNLEIVSEVITLLIELNDLKVKYFTAFSNLLTKMIDEVDKYTSLHIKNLENLAINFLALEEEPRERDEERWYLLLYGIEMHDIGKFFISKNDLLSKERDYKLIERINRHTEYGKLLLEETKIPPTVLAMIENHHKNANEITKRYDKKTADLIMAIMAIDKYSAIMDKRRDFYRISREGKIPNNNERVEIIKKEFEKFGILHFFEILNEAFYLLSKNKMPE